MSASQYKLQSGHCCFEDVSQSSKISVLFMSAMRFCDSLLNSLISFVCLKSWKKGFFVRVALELPDQLFHLCLYDVFLAVQLQKEVHQEFCNPKCCSRVSRGNFDPLNWSRDVLASFFCSSCRPICEFDFQYNPLHSRSQAYLLEKLILRLHANHFLYANSW